MRVAKRNGSDTTNLSKSPSPQMLDQCGYPQTQNICITFVQLWPNVSDVVPALYKCYRSTNVLCLLGRRCHHDNSRLMSIRHRNFPFLIKKCSMLMVKPSAFDVSEQSYGKFGRIYSLNNSQNYGI